MNIGIIVFSGTGNTLSVAQKLKEKLSSIGHTAVLEQIKVSGYNPRKIGNFQFTDVPDAGRYDAIVFTAPVQAFSLSPVMKKYFERSGSLKGKKAACLVTQYFPFSWMGGRQAIGWMKNFCVSKGIEVLGTGIVNWSKKDRDHQIVEVVDRLSGLF